MKGARITAVIASSILILTPLASINAAAPVTGNLLVSLDVNSSTISGTSVGASDGTSAMGLMQAAGMYSPSNNYITLGDSTNQFVDYGNIGSSSGNISLETWVNITNMHTNGWNIVASKWFGGTTGNDWHFGYHFSKLRLCYNGVCPDAGFDTTIRGTGWHHIAFTIEQPASGTCPGTGNGTVTLFYDGAKVAEDISTGACHPIASNMLFVIGDKRAAANLGLDGRVSKLRFYTRALSPTEISKVFRAEASRFGLDAAPYNTAVPAISATGSKIGILQNGSNGSWSNSPTTFSYRWYRASSAGGSYAAIAGATTASYLPGSSDFNQHLKFEVTATNSTGSTVETSTSTSIAAGEPSLTLSGAPSVTTFRTPRSLTLSPGFAGKITFTANGKRIAKCINLVANVGNSYSVTCPWSPSFIGFNNVSATFTSNDQSIISGSSINHAVFVQKRSTRR
jgi:hypothetical protein